MRVQDVLAVLGVAAVTTAFTVVLLGPGRVGATDKAQGIQPQIAQPKLTTQGCVFALKTDKPAYEAGEMPVLQIEATNPTDKPVETTVWVSLSSSSPANEFARVLRLPQPLWVEKCLVNLNPGETKKVALPTKIKLPGGQNVSITISDKDLTVLAREFGVQGGASPAQVAKGADAATQLAP